MYKTWLVYVLFMDPDFRQSVFHIAQFSLGNASRQPDMHMILPQNKAAVSQTLIPRFRHNKAFYITVTPSGPYLHPLKVFLLQLQAIGPSSPSDHFGNSVGYLLHGAFHSIHYRL